MAENGGFPQGFMLLMSSASLLVILTIFLTGSFDVESSAKVPDKLTYDMVLGENVQVLCNGQVVPFFPKKGENVYYCDDSTGSRGNQGFVSDPEARKVNLKVGQRIVFTCPDMFVSTWSTDRRTFNAECKDSLAVPTPTTVEEPTPSVPGFPPPTGAPKPSPTSFPDF